MQQFPNNLVLPQVKVRDTQLAKQTTAENYRFKDLDMMDTTLDSKPDNYAAQALNNIQKVTSFSKLYFSRNNIDEIQKVIRYTIWVESDKQYSIGDQDETELVVIMRGVYLEYSRMPSDISQYTKEILRLNTLVLNTIIPKLLSNITQYIDYLRDSQGPLRISERPENVSQAGLKQTRDSMSVRTGMSPTEYNNMFFQQNI